jgi:hypothetical protein
MLKKVSISNEQDCKKIEFIEVSEVNKILKSEVLTSVVEQRDDAIEINLYKWTEPSVELQVGIEIPEFIKEYVEKYDNLF